MRKRPLGGTGLEKERVYCDAHRMLRFSSAPVLELVRPSGASSARAGHAFRRFFFDGLLSARLDVGLVFHVGALLDSAAATLQLLESFLGMKVAVHAREHWEGAAEQSKGERAPSPSLLPLAGVGQAVARSYLWATSRSTPDLTLDDRWIDVCQPFLFVEYSSQEEVPLPKSLQELNVAGNGPRITHLHLAHRGTWLPVWLMQREGGYKADREARAQRLHLVRRQAEIECLESVLRALASGRLGPLIPWTRQSSNLQRYLQQSVGFLNRSDRRVEMDVPAAERILRLMEEAHPGDAIAIYQVVEAELRRLDARLNITRNVLRFLLAAIQALLVQAHPELAALSAGTAALEFTPHSPAPRP